MCRLFGLRANRGVDVELSLVSGSTPFACAAGSDYQKTGDEKMSYPLPFVYGEVLPRSVHLIVFSVVELFGMVVSYNGML